MTAGEGARSSSELETPPLTGVAAPPDDLRHLEAQIERTREQLGATVQELAARADVKTRARAKAAEVTGRVKSTTVQARTNAVARAGSVRSQVTGTTASAWEATPDQVRFAVTKGASGAKERWVPLTITAGVLVVGCLAVRQWRIQRRPV
jgi:hypothetical protein